mmetsp:Transcript_4676/g.10042  ORF Transcript_4676/g.10042 Transcript_4676/m.10042 type:complete len:94 (-) Transcript_4676:2202-2483(-)
MMTAILTCGRRKEDRLSIYQNNQSKETPNNSSVADHHSSTSTDSSPLVIPLFIAIEKRLKPSDSCNFRERNRSLQPAFLHSAKSKPSKKRPPK